MLYYCRFFEADSAGQLMSGGTMRPRILIVREELPPSDFLDKYIAACAEIAEAFRVFFRELYQEMPESRADLKKWISRLTCVEIEENKDDKYYEDLFGILWYASLQHRFDRPGIERALRAVQLEVAEDRLFPPKN
jgi:hypothetical protein